jgi:GNAT superfamily N-acetyltransferase
VLGRPLDSERAPFEAPEPSDFVVRRTKASELDAWIDVMVESALQLAGDDVSAAHDSFGRTAIEAAYRDMVRCSEVQCWTAVRGERIAGGALMSARDGVLQLGGAATHPQHRRRGIQQALLAARLTTARELGCNIAVVATQPGTQSQHNAQRCGFSLLYARAIWQLYPQDRAT